MAFEKKEFKLEEITGNLYVPGNPSTVGLVLGPGILGNRYGLDNVATFLVDSLQVPTIVLDPPSHHKNQQEFSFGNYATAERNAAQYLREEYNARKVVGGGHHGGAVAGLFANAGYSQSIEEKVIKALRCGGSDEQLSEVVAESHIEPPFDGLVLASLPRNLREAIPIYVFNPLMLKALHVYFQLQNRGNKTGYLGKNRQKPYQWKHLATDDLSKWKEYNIKVQNPHEYVDMLNQLDDNIARSIVDNVRQTPKLFLVPGRDIVSFGLKVVTKNDWSIELDGLKDKFETLGIKKDYHVFPRSAIFLNNVDKFELDSLYGLRAKIVQELIASFIERFVDN